MKSIGSDFLCSGLESRRKSTVFSTVRDACVGNDGNSSKDSNDDDDDEEFDDGEGGGDPLIRFASMVKTRYVHPLPFIAQ